ncbi:hypothetical protein AGMMS49579_18650 [Spirochaetia bacterium]|nr:hypothetical protein AGMMS49579_18650 [Spirochaetia bacterium]
MKLYLLRLGNGKTTRFCDPYIPQKNPWWNEELSVGIFEQAHVLPIIYHVENRNKPKEYMFSSHGLLFSGRLMQILKMMCENIHVFPAQMYLKGVERIFDEYYTIIFPHYEVLNIGKSILT